MRNLLVVIDYQNVALSYDPEEYKDELEHASRAIRKSADLVDIIHGQSGSDVLWVAYAPNVADALGEGISGMHPDLLGRMKPEDFFFLKDTKSAFGSKHPTESLCFDDVVRQGYDKIIVVGTSVIDCIQKTIEDMVQAGLEDKIILPRDACSPSPAFTNGQDSYISTLSDLIVCSTERLKRYLEDGKPFQHFPFKKNASVSVADDNQVVSASDLSSPKHLISDETFNLE